ncbi:hypothetical protein A3Q56_04331 [Intoshia linei]|uniref:Phosphodiesterase n=1 Tax=Intoshia linei TaxID=1819745 RepID=A0A177B3G6_9BILA|nr:hypothetical protein A3Q56_04331 [Intoshia linei]
MVVGSKILPEDVYFESSGNVISNVYKYNKFQHLKGKDVKKHDNEMTKIFGKNTWENVLFKKVLNSKQNESLGVVVFAAKKKIDVKNIISEYNKMMKYLFTLIKNAETLKFERKRSNHNQIFLKIIRKFFNNLDDLNSLLWAIMDEAKKLTNCERCSVFIKEDNELVALVFGKMDKEDINPKNSFRIPIDRGIAGHVAITGKVLNIENAYAHPLFNEDIDKMTGFITKNILCFPIKDENNQVMAVAQLCNKKLTNGLSSFTENDERMANTFGLYCYLSISHSLIYQNLRKASERSKLASEMMLFYMKVDKNQINSIIENSINYTSDKIKDLNNFEFQPRCNTQINDFTHVAFNMVLTIVPKHAFKINKKTLAHFILGVRNGYRDLPYHNWLHAFSVAHFFYVMNTVCDITLYLDYIDIFVIIVSCLCHDLDHRGTNNAFHLQSKSTLSSLYSSHGSVMEEHHFAQTLNILNVEGCNIFENSNRENYAYLLESIHEIILATDLSNHLKIVKDIEKLANSVYNKQDKSHRKLLKCLIITCCDLCDVTKTWENSKQTALKVYEEFNAQGDLEESLNQKRSFNLNNVADIPKIQIQFLSEIALPVYKSLSKIIPQMSKPYENANSNLKQWNHLLTYSIEDLMAELYE